MSNEEISTESLKEKTKQIKTTPSNQIDYYSNIILLCPKISLEDKIFQYGVKTYVGNQSKDTIQSLSSIQKLLNIYYSHADEINSNESIIIPLIKGIHRIAILFEKENNMLSLYYFNLAINLLNKVKDYKYESYKQFVRNGFQFKKNNISLLSQQEKFAANPSLNMTLIAIDPEDIVAGKVVYLISKQWYNWYVSFISSATVVIEDKYNKEDVLTRWINPLMEEENCKYDSVFCSEINNISLIAFNDYWHDDSVEHSYTNVYLSKHVTANDYITVSKENWDILHETFGIEPKMIIERNADEIKLIDIKVIVLSKFFIEKSKQNYIKMRHIQISKKDSLEAFKAKLNRCIRGFFGIDDSNPDTNFYLTIYDAVHLNKNDLFKLTVSYSENIPQSQSDFNLMLIENDEQFKQLINEHNSNGQRNKFVIEFNSIVVSSFLDNQSLLKGNKCRYCKSDKMLVDNDNDSIDNTNVIKCKQCPNRSYCSKECLKKDNIHSKYHTLLNKYLNHAAFDLSILQSLSIDNYINHNSKHGLTGLINLGNTCFMNSALQCLSHCEALTLYFLSKYHQQEINPNTKYGSGGEIAKAYYELIEQLWVGNKPYIHPINFKEIFTSFVKQFAGFSQHDSHEMLSFMLDSLHEDLNRIKVKPYIELNEQKNDETDIEASTRWWSTHLNRENSIIVDLFHGQYKSTVKCPTCNKISITYDPFLSLGLPLDGTVKGEVLLVSKDTQTLKKVSLKFIENEKCAFIKPRLLETLLSNSKLAQRELIGYICNAKKMYQKKLINDDLLFNFLQKSPNSKIIFYEEDTENINTKILFTVIPLLEEGDIDQPLFFPKDFLMKPTATVKEFYEEIFSYYKRLTNLPSDFELNIQEEDSRNYLPFTLHIVNNLTCDTGHPCDYCNMKNCHHCLFKFAFDLTMGEVKNSQKYKRAFLIYIKIQSSIYDPFALLYQDYKEYQTVFTKQESMDLYDCFDAFRKEEKLEKENMWYCSDCKEHQQAFKQMDIFRLPKILVISLKRFKLADSIFGNSKKDTLVSFPVDNLCLNKYIVGNSTQEYNYELFGVNQHFGVSGGGHYTALCKNNGIWYVFDDESVDKLSHTKNVVSSAAYILFYKLKD